MLLGLETSTMIQLSDGIDGRFCEKIKLCHIEHALFRFRYEGADLGQALNGIRRRLGDIPDFPTRHVLHLMIDQALVRHGSASQRQAALERMMQIAPWESRPGTDIVDAETGLWGDREALEAARLPVY